MQSSGSETDRTRSTRRQDRRDAAAPRREYEALVEVGADASGGFEAESVDVSLDGMRMRTAYLPAVGSTLTCRFDGFGGEIMAEAEVVWAKREGRGGELGMRFVGLDAHALTLLQDLCNPRGADTAQEREPSQPTGAPPGTRVRLHIEGLGSPMRARVRDAARGEVLIGSNLEFLKVGRDVELEDMDRGRRRVALIEHVAVEIDRETNIPQLVVALSYDSGAAGEEELSTAPYRVKPTAGGEAAQPASAQGPTPHESTPEPTVINSDGRQTPSAPIPRRMAHAPRAVRASEAGPDSQDGSDDEDESEQPLPARARAAQKVEALAKTLGPKLASAGAGARGALGKMWSTMRDRHAERRRERAKSRTPKRTTAPPPSGALRSEGRRLVRDASPPASDPGVENESAPVESAPEEKSPRKRTLVTAAVAALAVVAIYFGSTHLKGRIGGEPEAPSAPAAARAAAAGSADGIANANVPLFGATPLSTTEPVPAPPAPGEAALPNDAAGEGEGEGEGEGDEPSAPPAAGLAKEWGVGDVVNPTIFRIRMDDAIGGITGAETANGFTITIPGRKSISSAAGLAARDKRLDAVNVVNYPDRAEVTLQFKKEVPAFMARAKGKRLEIEIATPKKGHKAADDDDDAPKPKKPAKKPKKK
jgi:hypothetical protein